MREGGDLIIDFVGLPRSYYVSFCAGKYFQFREEVAKDLR